MGAEQEFTPAQIDRIWDDWQRMCEVSAKPLSWPDYLSKAKAELRFHRAQAKDSAARPPDTQADRVGDTQEKT